MDDRNVFLSVQVKTTNSQVTVRLPVINICETSCVFTSVEDAGSINIVWDESLLALRKVPQHLCDTSLETLKQLTLAEEQEVDHEPIARARLDLQEWFQKELESIMTTTIPKHPYILRHIIPRVSASLERTTTPKMQPQPSKTKPNNTSFAIQSPVSRFHTDSTHTAFCNLWLPVAVPVSNDHLAFLYHYPTQQLLTARCWDDILAGTLSARAIRNVLESSCCILYASPMGPGDAWIFRSGGVQGVFHGSIRFVGEDKGDDRDKGGRRSVEFRCQPYDEEHQKWIYGEPQQNAVLATRSYDPKNL